MPEQLLGGTQSLLAHVRKQGTLEDQHTCGQLQKQGFPGEATPASLTFREQESPFSVCCPWTFFCNKLNISNYLKRSSSDLDFSALTSSFSLSLITPSLFPSTSAQFICTNVAQAPSQCQEALGLVLWGRQEQVSLGLVRERGLVCKCRRKRAVIQDRGEGQCPIFSHISQVLIIHCSVLAKIHDYTISGHD